MGVSSSFSELKLMSFISVDQLTLNGKANYSSVEKPSYFPFSIISVLLKLKTCSSTGECYKWYPVFSNSYSLCCSSHCYWN